MRNESSDATDPLVKNERHTLIERLLRTHKQWPLILLCMVSVSCIPASVQPPLPAPLPTIAPDAADCHQDALERDQAIREPIERVIFLENDALMVMDATGGNETEVAQDAVLFSIAPNNKRLFYTLADERTFIYEIRKHVTRELETQFEPSSSKIVNVLTWTPDGECLVLVDKQNGRLRLYHLSDNRVEEWFHPLASNLNQIMLISPTGKHFVTRDCSKANELCIFGIGGTELDTVKVKVLSYPLWSPDGRYLLYSDADVPGHVSRPDTLYYLDQDDRWSSHILLVASDDGLEGFGDVAWSPDGKRIVADVGLHLPEAIAVIDFPQGTYRQISFPPGVSFSLTSGPLWSPDGSRIIFSGFERPLSTERHHSYAVIYTMKVDGIDLKLLRRRDSTDWVEGIYTPAWVTIP